MDYRVLLKKYMDRVADCEGVTFRPQWADTEFTQEEVAELKKIEEEGSQPEAEKKIEEVGGVEEEEEEPKTGPTCLY